MKNDIKEVLNSKVKPILRNHLGDVEFVDYKNGVVYVRFKGSCKGCPLSTLTLKGVVHEILNENLHGIENVQEVK